MFKNFNILIGVVSCIFYCTQSFSQTTYSKTYTIKETGGTVSFSIVPTSGTITSGGNQYNKVIVYNVNYSIAITYKNVPSGAKLRNTEIKFLNSASTATDGISYVSPYIFSSTNEKYTDNLSTTTSPSISGYTMDDLTDKNKINNSQILSLAKYRTVNLKFTLQSAGGSEYNITDYDKTNGDNLSGVARSTALPIRLLSFNVSQSTTTNILDWKTSVETNNNYFVVEKSNSGSSFDSIAIIKGAGNSNQILSYSYSDAQPFSGNNYYRLKQVDYDGNYSYSPIENIYFSGTIMNSTNLSIFPNPGNGSISIKGDWDNYSSVRVTSMLGQIVYSSNITSSNLTLPSSLAKGMYVINFYKNNVPSKTLKYMLR